MSLSSTVLKGDLDLWNRLFINGTLDLATNLGNDGAPQVYEFIRRDSQFDPVRFRLFGDVVLSRRLTVFNQFLLDPSSDGYPTASFIRSYLRYDLFETPQADLNIQAGKIPTVFGNLGRRSYSDRNPLIAVPLVYHYFSSLRSNQLPADNADLLEQRGNGLVPEFGGFHGGGAPNGGDSPIGFNGLPMIYDTCWDTGVQAVGSISRLEYSLAVTQGTLSGPRATLKDNNEGKQLAFRLKYFISPQLAVGNSFASGPYLASVVASGLSPQQEVEDFHQRIYGFDLEYSVRHLSLVAEVVSNLWESPNI